MSLKIINITIPDEAVIREIETFSPEENMLMLKIGSNCILEGRKAVAGLTQKEIYQKIKDESKDEVKRLELEIIVEKESSKKLEERISKIYETQIEQMKKQMEKMSQQISIYESENKDILQKEISKAREKFDLLLQEKDNQNKLNRESVDTLKESILKLTNKSTSHKGSDGEKQFSDYAETFMDFKGYEIVDKHTQGGAGDFHLHFEDFDVLVDAKNYKKKVPIDQRDKIKKDLQKNEHINFAWLVSLNTSIDKYDKAPVMYEWINTKQCIVYINNLVSFEDPKKILRIVWYTCKELYKRLIEDTNFDETELTELREKNYKLMDKIKNIRKTIREINTSMNATRNLIQLMDDELRGILETETNEIVTSNFSLFDDWWDQNIEVTQDESLVISTELWTKFKQDNKNSLKEMEITAEKFKQYIKTKVPLSSIVLRSSKGKGAYDIKGIKLKKVLEEEEQPIYEEDKLELELNEDVIKKKKVIKKVNKNIYFDEETDSKIIEEYETEDIIDLSVKYNIRPWEVVSLLMKYKIITKRAQAKGYDKYKDTDEYKEKLNKE
jgi:hypothetical protein